MRCWLCHKGKGEMYILTSDAPKNLHKITLDGFCHKCLLNRYDECHKISGAGIKDVEVLPAGTEILTEFSVPRSEFVQKSLRRNLQ